jgi:ribose transport system substrate-binding protein
MVPLALLGVLAAIASGCGSSDDTDTGSASTPAASTQAGTTAAETTGSDQFADLNAELQKAQTRPTQIAITEPLNGKAPTGKVVEWLQCGVPACVQLTKPLKEAAEAAGWTLKVVDEGLTPEEVKAAWQQVVRDSPDAVVLSGGFPPSIFKDELAQVKAKGIPIVSYGDPAITNPDGYTGIVDGGLRMRDYLGKYFADYVATKTGGKGNILYVYTSGFPVLVAQKEGYEKEIAKVCPDCKTEYYDAPVTSIGKDLSSKIASQVQAHPDTDYIIGGFNDMLLGVPEALKGVGVDTSKVKLITQDDDANALKAVQNGDIEMLLQNPGGETQWQSMDIILRKLLNQDVSGSTDLDSYTKWIITKDNLPPESEWDDLNSVQDYKAQFQKLWGLGGP